MATSDAVDRARESYRRQAWADAYARLADVDQASPLEPEDLERLATAAYLLGKDDDSADGWARAYRERLRQGDPERAARCALWLASGVLMRGEHARAGAWIARARGLPLHHRGVVASEPGLYFLGLWFLYGFTSSLLGGVGRDAAHIAEQIGTR
jgi:hypothetical protein